MKGDRQNINENAEGILLKNNLKVLTRISYDNIISFVFENISQPTFVSRIYFLVNLIGLGALIWISYLFFAAWDGNTGSFFGFLFLGVISGGFLVIPVHELIHGIAYKLVGAPSLHFGMDLKQLIFYVASDRFLVNRLQFSFVALAPFFLINLFVFILVFSTASPGILLACISFLFLHNMMCIGDFAMISYFRLHKGKDLYTFDILEERLSYICEKTD